MIFQPLEVNAWGEVVELLRRMKRSGIKHWNTYKILMQGLLLKDKLALTYRVFKHVIQGEILPVRSATDIFTIMMNALFLRTGKTWQRKSMRRWLPGEYDEMRKHTRQLSKYIGV